MKRFIDRMLLVSSVILLSACNPNTEFATFDPANSTDAKDNKNILLEGTATPTPTATVTATATPDPTATPAPTYRDYNFAVSTTQNKPTVDVVFIVDDSGSMADEQQYLSQGVQNLVTNLKGNNVNFHVYTTSNDGNKSITTSSTVNGVQSYVLKPERNTSTQAIQMRDGMSDQTLTNIGNVFSQTIVSLGTSGSGTEQGACSLLRTLYDQGPNKIFNTNNYAAFVLISDEQDSSSISNCFYEKTWDQNNIASLWGFPGASVSTDLQRSFVEKADLMFGVNGYFFSAIIHDQIEDPNTCTMVAPSVYGTKYRDIANMAQNSNVYSICMNDYSQALTGNIGNFISNLTNTVYTIALAGNETIDSVYLISGGVETQLQTPADYSIRGSNIEFINNVLGANDSVRVNIKSQ